jgi:pilus assembly protein CpaB
MFKRRGLFLVIMSLTMGGLAAWAANNWVQERLGPTDEMEVSTDTVVVAAIDIPYGTKVTARHSKILTLPEGTAPARAFREREDVENMVARANVLSGEILMMDRFAEHDTGSTLAALVSDAMRAITIRVDDVVGVAGFLLPGNRVDVLATRMNSSRRAVTDTILKNLKVLAVDQTASTQENDPVIVRAVTLEMTPSQSETLVKAKEEGTIQLTLRNPMDRQELAEIPPPPPAPRPVARAAPRPQAPAPADLSVTIIRGTRVETTKPES